MEKRRLGPVICRMSALAILASLVHRASLISPPIGQFVRLLALGLEADRLQCGLGASKFDRAVSTRKSPSQVLSASAGFCNSDSDMRNAHLISLSSCLLRRSEHRMFQPRFSQTTFSSLNARTELEVSMAGSPQFSGPSSWRCLATDQPGSHCLSAGLLIPLLLQGYFD